MAKILKARPDQASDLQHIARLSKQHWGYSPEYMRVWNHDQTLTADFISQNFVYYAVDGAEVAGFYALELSPEVCELKHLWVSPGYIRRGIGKQLLTHLKTLLAEVGAVTCTIVAEPHAEGFYARMGAVRIGLRPMPALEQELPIMRLAISDSLPEDLKVYR